MIENMIEQRVAQARQEIDDAFDKQDEHIARLDV